MQSKFRVVMMKRRNKHFRKNMISHVVYNTKILSSLLIIMITNTWVKPTKSWNLLMEKRSLNKLQLKRKVAIRNQMQKNFSNRY